MDHDLAKALVNPKVQIFVKNGKQAVSKFEYLYSKFDKFIADLGLSKFQVSND